MEEMPGEVHKAWKKFVEDFQLWQKTWNARHPHEARIIDEFMERNSGESPGSDPADFWKE